MSKIRPIVNLSYSISVVDQNIEISLMQSRLVRTRVVKEGVIAAKPLSMMFLMLFNDYHSACPTYL